MRRSLQRLVEDKRAATAVEFALVSNLLILLVLFILSVGMIEFIAQSLDYATQKAARQVMTGAVQKGGVGQAAFQNIVCSYLPATVACGNVIVNLYTVPYGAQPGGYYAFTNGTNGSGLLIPPLSNGSAQFSPGMQGQYEYLQVIYPVTFFPAAFASILGLATYNGSPAYPVVATAAFRNEQF